MNFLTKIRSTHQLCTTDKGEPDCDTLEAALVLDQAINLIYGLRNFARHDKDCQFVLLFTGVESENQPCDCRFDEVLDAFDAFFDKVYECGSGNGDAAGTSGS